MMDVDEPSAELPIALTEIKTTDLASKTMVIEARTACRGIPFIDVDRNLPSRALPKAFRARNFLWRTLGMILYVHVENPCDLNGDDVDWFDSVTQACESELAPFLCAKEDENTVTRVEELPNGWVRES